MQIGNRQEITRKNNVVQRTKLSLIKRSKTRQKESTALMRRRFSALSLQLAYGLKVQQCDSHTREVGGDRQRPVSLLTTLTKVSERVMFDHMYEAFRRKLSYNFISLFKRALLLFSPTFK